MATKHTEHYQLNLWEAEDSFLRTEFNENSAKIDAALDGHEARLAQAEQTGFTKLMEFTVPEPTEEMELDVSQIDWAEWQYVLIDMDLRGGWSATLYPNNLPGMAYSTAGASHYSNTLVGSINLSDKGQNATRIILECCKMPQRRIFARRESYWGTSDITFSNLSTLNMKMSPAGNYIGVGSTIIFWGVR